MKHVVLYVGHMYIVQAILDQKNLTGLAGGVREGQHSTTVPNPANGSFPSRSCRLSAGCGGLRKKGTKDAKYQCVKQYK